MAKKYNNKKFGVKIRPAAVRSYNPRPCFGASQIDLPQQFELKMRDFCEIKDQGYINSCVAFASSLVGECENYKRTGNKEEFSTGNTYGNEVCRKGYMGKGMYVDDTVLGLCKIGFVPNHLFNVNLEMPKAYEVRKGREDLDEIGQYLKPTTAISLKVYGTKEENIRSIKEALYTYQSPIVMCSTDFFKEPHCVVIYGWDNNDNFKYQNSWGVSQLDPGYGYLSIDDIYEAYVLVFDEIELPFDDVKKEDWYYQEIKNIYCCGMLEGITENKFGPKDSMKRCDAVLMLTRILEKFEKSINTYLKTKGEQSISYQENIVEAFKDVPEDSYYFTALNYASSLGLIKGDENNNFNPDNNITRAQFATIITRLYDFLLNVIDTAATWIDLPDDFGYLKLNKKYSDVPADSWFKTSVDKITNLEIMNGVDSSHFNPNVDITRAEAIVVLERLCKKIDDILKKC